MTYSDLDDKAVISLLEGNTLKQVLSAMNSTTTGDFKDIDDIYKEIIEMSKPN